MSHPKQRKPSRFNEPPAPPPIIRTWLEAPTLPSFVLGTESCHFLRNKKSRKWAHCAFQTKHLSCSGLDGTLHGHRYNLSSSALTKRCVSASTLAWPSRPLKSQARHSAWKWPGRLPLGCPTCSADPSSAGARLAAHHLTHSLTCTFESLTGSHCIAHQKALTNGAPAYGSGLCPGLSSLQLKQVSSHAGCWVPDPHVWQAQGAIPGQRQGSA